MSARERLDTAVFARGLAKSREEAKSFILEGKVFVGGERADKPGMPVADSDAVEVRGERPRFVSRGGFKLQKAVEEFGLSLTGKTCADIGASTGGFTDCMLQNGAVKVYSVDVGYGQFDWTLRNNPAVVCLERTNFRYVTAAEIPDPLDFASADVSFISLAKILPPLYPLLRPGGEAVCLVKPQFEAGRGAVGKNGVVREEATHIEVLERVAAFAAEGGYAPRGLTYSPFKGPRGNIEYLLFLRKDGEPADIDIPGMVARSHKELD